MSWHDLNKRELASLISSGTMEPHDLTFAVEELGKIAYDDPALVRLTLTPLLSHESPLVREGALYGLDGHLDAELWCRVEALAFDDPSKGVREAAVELLA